MGALQEPCAWLFLSLKRWINKQTARVTVLQAGGLVRCRCYVKLNFLRERRWFVWSLWVEANLMLHFQCSWNSWKQFFVFFYTLCSLILLCGPYPCVWLYSGKYLNARSHTHLLNEHCRKTADRNKWTAHNLNSPFSFFFSATEVMTFKSHAKHLLLEISSEIYFVSVIPFLFCLHRHTHNEINCLISAWFQ